MRHKRTIGQRVRDWWADKGCIQHSDLLAAEIDREIKKCARDCFNTGRDYEELMEFGGAYSPEAAKRMRDRITKKYRVRFQK